MGFLDRFKGNRGGASGNREGTRSRAPANFDELQAAEDAGEALASPAPSKPGAAPRPLTAAAPTARDTRIDEDLVSVIEPDPADAAEADRAGPPSHFGNALDIELPPRLGHYRGEAAAPALAAPGYTGADRPSEPPISALPPVDSRIDYSDSLVPLAPKAQAPVEGASPLPLIGRLSVRAQQRLLGLLMLAGLLLLVATVVLALAASNRSTAQLMGTSQALVQSQRLAKAVTPALMGQAPAFDEVKDAAQVLATQVRRLKGGDAQAAPVVGTVQALLLPVMPLVDRAEKSAGALLAQQKTLQQVGEALRSVKRQVGELMETAEAIANLKLQTRSVLAEQSATGQLLTLTQRIGKSAHEFLTVDGVSSEAAFLLGKDMKQFRELAAGLLDGQPEWRLPGTRDLPQRERLERLLRQHEALDAQVAVILSQLPAVVNARDAQQFVLKDSEPLRQGLEQVQASLAEDGGLRLEHVVALAAGLLLMAVSAWGFVRLYVADKAVRAAQAELQRREAERQEQEAKRVNDANQAAILRLMNELQAVAEGDLTQQATVTEDITGAIADSVNYTVEELRSLVTQVQRTVHRVADTTERVDSTSTELLAASDEQLREIRETGDAVLRMAHRINEVSGQAQQSADVARQSLAAAGTGLTAVQNSIGGMNAIRDQMQETSKRIKRLGESSQEIGEITELITDITEQTNVLALNAAIQAASAGEAGRGFSVVAEEVQRLAERSADATRQIANLVKGIQADTQDAVAAMARSTEGVVQGARLSDAAGAALNDINRVTRELAELIERISQVTSREADSANVVAGNIQHIFAVTEQTGDGTRSTAQMVRELSRTAEELRQAVARFKL